MYLSVVCPTLFWGDGGFLVSGSYLLGIPHPPGHPLFVLLGKASTLIPLGNIAFRLNVLALIFCLLSFYLLVSVIEITLELVAKTWSLDTSFSKNNFPQIVSFCFALSGIAIFQAGSTETYSLNLFLSLALIFLAVKCEKDYIAKGNAEFLRHFLLGGFIAGLSLGNHSLLIAFLAIPYTAYFSIRIFEKSQFRKILFFFFFIVLGLSIYIYLPLRASETGDLNFGPQNWYNFYEVATGKAYRSHIFSLGELINKTKLSDWYFATSATLDIFIRNLNYFWVIFLIIGVPYCIKRSKVSSLFLLTIILIEIFITYLPTMITHQTFEAGGTVGYYLVPLALSYVFAGCGFKASLDYLLSKLHYKHTEVLRNFIYVVVLLFTLVNFFELKEKFDHREDYSAYVYGKAVLNYIDYGGIFLAGNDAELFIPLYLNSVERTRTDAGIWNLGLFFNNNGLKILKERLPKIFLDISVDDKDFLRMDQFQNVIRRIQENNRIYLGAGNPFKYSLLEDRFLSPHVLFFSIGNKDKNEDEYHWAETQKFLDFIKTQKFFRNKDTTRNIAVPIYNIAVNFYEKGYYELAAKQYRYVLNLDPLLSDAASNLILSYFKAGDYNEIVNLGPNFTKMYEDPDILYNYVLALVNLGRRGEALAVLREGIIRFREDKKLKELKEKL